MPGTVAAIKPGQFPKWIRLFGNSARMRAVRTEMAAAMRSGQQGAQSIGGAFDRVDAGHEKLLRSSHRVSAQIHTVARDFAAGASAGDIFAASLEGIGRSLNISLGALAGLAIGSVAVQKIYQLHEALKKTTEEVEKALGRGQ